MLIGVLCFSLGSRLRGNDGPCGVTLTLALSHRGRGDDGMEMETRKKPGAVFNPVLLRERSWILASAAERQRLFDRVMDRACYQQSQTVAIDAPVIGPRWGGLPDSQQKSSARVVRRQDRRT